MEIVETHTHTHEHECEAKEQECEHESHWWNKVVVYAATIPFAIPAVHFVWHFIAHAFGLPCP
jgi:hypothetical protein